MYFPLVSRLHSCNIIVDFLWHIMNIAKVNVVLVEGDRDKKQQINITKYKHILKIIKPYT